MEKVVRNRYGRGYVLPARRATRKNRKRVVQPGLSMSVQDIVERFMRNVPVNVVRREAVYSEQEEFDLEKVSRMDFGEKKEFADEMADRAEGLQNELKERERSKAEAKAKKAKEAAEKAQAANQQTSGGAAPPPAGIGTP